MKIEPRPDPGLHLPAPLTLQLYAGAEVIFSSEKHWLHPLFDLEAFLAQRDQDPAQTSLVDRITGRAAALLVARLGIKNLHTQILSRRAIPVLEQHNIAFHCGELVERVTCATEDLLSETLDLEAAWSLLQERRSRTLTAI